MAFVILYLFKFLQGKQGFCSFGISMCRIFALKFSFKVPTLSLPNEVHRESMQKKFWFIKGSSCQELPALTSSYHCCFNQ